MNWQAVTAICAVIGLTGAIGFWVMKGAIAEEFAKLDNRFIRREGSNLTGHEIEQRLTALEGR